MARVAANRRLIAWGAWLALLVVLGVSLYLALPPMPRWCLTGCGPIDYTLAEQGRFLAWQDDPGGATGTAILRDLCTGEPIASFLAGAGGPAVLRCAPDGHWIVRGGNDRLRIAVVEDGTERTIHMGDGVSVRWVDISQHGEVMAVQLVDKPDSKDVHHRLVLLETGTGARLAELGGTVAQTVNTADGSRMCFVCEQNGLRFMKAWDVRERRWAFTLPHVRNIGGGSPDGRTLICRLSSPGLAGSAVCDVERGTALVIGSEELTLDHYSFAKDGRRLALRYRKPGAANVEVHDLDPHRRLVHIDSAYLPQVALSPDGGRLALQALVRPGDEPNIAVAMLDVDTGRRLWQQPPAPASHFWVAPRPAFGPDGRSVVVYRHDPHRAEILDAETGALLATLPLAGTDVVWTDTSVTAAPDRRTQVVQTTVMPANRPDWWPDWLDRTFPNDIMQEFIVIDVEARRVRSRLQIPTADETKLLCGGRLLMTSRQADATHPSRLCCWDLPGRPPWCWVIGIPAALGVISVAVSWWRHRRRAAAS